MIVGSISENINTEKRVAITPDIIKKYRSLGLEVNLSKNYALHIGITDKEYVEQGANIINNDDELISSSNIIVQMGLPTDKNLEKFKEKQIIVGVLNPYTNEKKLKEISSKNISCFSVCRNKCLVDFLWIGYLQYQLKFD